MKFIEEKFKLIIGLFLIGLAAASVSLTIEEFWQ